MGGLLPSFGYGGNRFEQLAPVANRRDADILEILDGQPWQRLGVHIVLGEGTRVFAKSKIFEPHCNVHEVALT